MEETPFSYSLTEPSGKVILIIINWLQIVYIGKFNELLAKEESNQNIFAKGQIMHIKCKRTDG